MYIKLKVTDGRTTHSDCKLRPDRISILSHIHFAIPFTAEHTGAGVATPRNTDVRMTSMALEEWAALSNLSQFSHCVANILDVNLPYTTYIP